MTTQYWIRDNGNGPYCEGDPTGETNILLVTKRPKDSIYYWNTETSKWDTTLELKRKWIESAVEGKLRSAGCNLLPDMWDTFTAEQKTMIRNCRTALREVLNKQTVEETVLPPCYETCPCRHCCLES